jgi:hypothetical protein
MHMKIKFIYGIAPKNLSCLPRINNWTITGEETGSFPKFSGMSYVEGYQLVVVKASVSNDLGIIKHQTE